MGCGFDNKTVKVLGVKWTSFFRTSIIILKNIDKKYSSSRTFVFEDARILLLTCCFVATGSAERPSVITMAMCGCPGRSFVKPFLRKSSRASPTINNVKSRTNVAYFYISDRFPTSLCQAL